MNLEMKFGGEYRLVVTRPDGSTQDTGWIPNIITDIGLDMLGDGVGGGLVWCRIGTGTSTPVAGQQALDAQSAATNNVTTSTAANEGSTDYGFLVTKGYTFTQGAVVGNMAEIGVGSASSGNTLLSRARIVDGVGSPTTITVTALDQLTAYYRLRNKPVLTDATGSVVIGGVTYNYTGRLANAASYGNLAAIAGGLVPLISEAHTYAAGCTIGAITATPTSASGNLTTSVTAASYTSGTYFRDNTISWSITQGNATGGVQGIRFAIDGNNNSFFQYVFDAPIPKDNTKVLTLNVRVSWGRI